VQVSAELDEARRADGLVVPGVGAFEACIDGIRALGADAVVAERVEAERPVLGICVGMQVLFEEGLEGRIMRPGLGVLPGTVSLLGAPILPHMGWNTVEPPADSALFAGIPADTRFYFVHSYAVYETDGAVAHTEHGERFVSAVEHGPVSATQFHPEKSGDAGAALLRNWLGTL
jgi:glutamine amidotransferase